MPEPLRGLVVDWGGVLTLSLADSMSAWAEADGIDWAFVQAVLREWLAPGPDGSLSTNPVHALERGELGVSEFEVLLAAELTHRSGQPVAAPGMVERMFSRFAESPEMLGLVRRAHAAGIRTALLSNSWGNGYPREGWDEIFDAVVISGEVGMRKPEPAIFHHTLELIGLEARHCAFVDDLAPNVRAAVELGFAGVHHRSYEQTEAELTALFGQAF